MYRGEQSKPEPSDQTPTVSSIAAKRVGPDRQTPALYPVQKAVKRGKWSREDITKVLKEKVGEKSKRRGSLVSISLKQGNETRRWSAGELIKNWRATSILAIVENEVAVQKLDSMLKNLQFGIYDQAKRARKLSIKCMWLFLVVVMHIVLIYEITQRTIQYYYNPIITTFTLHTPKAIDFPQVYICMAASANRTFMLQHPKEFALSNYFRERIIRTRKKRDLHLVSAERLRESSISVPEIHEYLDLHDSLLNRVRRQANLSDVEDFDVYSFFRDAGYNVEEIFLECSFYSNGYRKLDCKNIVEPVFDINYGLCYSVKLDAARQSTAGTGLTLVLNPHVDLYPTDEVNAPRSSGVYVSISYEYDPTNWLKACAAPGQYAKIDIKATRVNMLNLDSGSLIQPCVEEAAATDLMRIFNSTYTRTSCQLDCMLREFKERCQCILMVDKKVLRQEVIEQTRFCTPNRSRSCVLPNVTHNTTAMANINKCRSKCHTPCRSWRFGMRTSTAPLHPPAFARFQLPPNATADSLVLVHVSFPAIEYAELVQSPSLTFVHLVSDVGGLMNLWMSASIITIVSTLAALLRFCIRKGMKSC